MFAFLLAVVFVFLVLAAQYESLTLPLAVILIVPMCLIAAITGIILRGMDNNILTQVGFIVLIGLAAKNAILIVEFAEQLEDQGRDRWAAAAEAARLRLRPILMTSLAFIFGVVPLVWAVGAGAELRQALGTAVFAGMIGVTAFGLIFTPVFYVVCRWLAAGADRPHRHRQRPPSEPVERRERANPGSPGSKIRRIAQVGAVAPRRGHPPNEHADLHRRPARRRKATNLSTTPKTGQGMISATESRPWLDSPQRARPLARRELLR